MPQGYPVEREGYGGWNMESTHVLRGKLGRTLLSLIFYSLTGIGISLGIKANIGVSSFNSLNVALSHVLGLRIGVVTTILNGAFLVSYMALTRFKHPITYVLQAIAVSCFGWMLDFFTYEVFADLYVTSYFQRILLFTIGTVIGGIATGMVLNLKILAFPLESACSALAEKTGWAFSRIRYGVDIFSVLGSLALSLIFGLPLFVREGTLISLFLLSASISLTKRVYERAAKSENQQIYMKD